MTVAQTPDRRTPLVSVVVRTKDRPEMLRRALADIADQTYDEHEVIVVNDGGDVAVLRAVIDELPEAYRSRIMQIDHESSQGRWPTANDGVASARGEYITLHDDDDLWHPEFLERTVAFLDAKPDAPAVVVPTEVVIEELRDGGWIDVGRYMWTPPGDVVTLFDLLRHNRAVPIGMLIRRSVYDEIGLYDDSLDVVGDWEFNLRLARAGTIGYLDGPALAYWRQRPTTTGALGNSVHAEPSAHLKFDRIVRERALQRDLSPEGLAQLLYLSKYIDERIAEAERRLGAEQRIGELEAALHQEIWDSAKHLERRIWYFSLGATVARIVRRVLRRR